MDMRHGLLRTSCSRNPENTSNPLIFLRKMATFRCFALHKVINFHASMKFMTFCRLSHFIRHRRKIQQGTAVLSTTAPCIIFTTADDLQLLSRLNNYVYSFLRTCGKMPHPDHSSVEVSSSGSESSAGSSSGSSSSSRVSSVSGCSSVTVCSSSGISSSSRSSSVSGAAS